MESSELSTEKVKINPELIPKIEMHLLCKSLLEAAQRFYADPGNLKAFEEWQKDRNSSKRQ